MIYFISIISAYLIGIPITAAIIAFFGKYDEDESFIISLYWPLLIYCGAMSLLFDKLHKIFTAAGKKYRNES